MARAAAAAVAAIAVTAGLAACSGETIAKNAVEKAVEKAASEDGGAVDVDFDSDDAVMRMHSDDGSSLSIGGGDIPEGFPDDLPLPSDYTVAMATTDAAEGTVFLTLGSPESLATMTARIEKTVAAGTYEQTDHSTMTMGEITRESYNLTRDGIDVTISVHDGDEGGLTATYMVQQEE